MAKWYGKIGYAETVEVEPGIFIERIEERSYYGDLIRNTRSLQNSGSVNDNVNISNQLSIVSDPYAYEHFHAIRYVELMDTKWKVSNVDVAYPRLTLTIGGLYNGEQAGTTQ